MDCLIVDDDEITRKTIEKLVRNTDFLNLRGSCSSAVEAYNFFMQNRVDLILLDVMMPEMTGIELIRSLGDNKPKIILITSEKGFASEAFDHDVVDFITKPVTADRFYKAVLKVRKIYEKEITRPTGPAASQPYLFVKADSRYVKINSGDILYIEALADYVSIYTTTEDRFVIHSTMKSIEEKLPQPDFIRIHNSFIVRLDKITSIEDNTVALGKKLFPVSRSHKKDLMDRLRLL